MSSQPVFFDLGGWKRSSGRNPGGNGLGHRIRAQAAGADLDATNLAIGHLSPDLLQVRQKATFGFVVGVTDIISGAGTFPADITNLGHDDLLIWLPWRGVFSCSVHGEK